jgi:hypothetical protein
MNKNRFSHFMLSLILGAAFLLVISSVVAQDGTSIVTTTSVNNPRSNDIITNTSAGDGMGNGNGGNISHTVNVAAELINGASLELGLFAGDGGDLSGNGGNASVDITTTAAISGDVTISAFGGDGDNGGNAQGEFDINDDLGGDTILIVTGGDGNNATGGNGGNASANVNINANNADNIDILAMGGCSVMAGGTGGNVTQLNVNLDVDNGADVMVSAEAGCGDVGGDVSDVDVNLNGNYADVAIGASGGCGTDGGSTGDINGQTTTDQLGLGNVGGNGCDVTGTGGDAGDINLNVNGSLEADVVVMTAQGGCGPDQDGQDGVVNANISGELTTDTLAIMDVTGCGDANDINLDISGLMNGSTMIMSTGNCGALDPTVNVAISGEVNATINNPALMSIINCGDYVVDISGIVNGDIGVATNLGDAYMEITGTINGDVAALSAELTGTVQVVLSGDAAISGMIAGSAGQDFGGARGAQSQLVFSFITRDRSEYESFIGQLATADPMGGSITFQGRVYTWTSFDGLVNQLRLIEAASHETYGFSADGFCVQAGSYITLDDGTINVYDSFSKHLLSFDAQAQHEAAPLNNLLLESSDDGYVQLYRLSSGEYQVNVGPNAESKVHTCIWTGVTDPENVRQFAVDA